MIAKDSIYQTLLDNMHVAVLLLDDEMRLQYLNAAAESLLKISAQRLDGAFIEQACSEGGSIPEGLVKALRSGQQFTKRQTVLRLPLPKDITVDYTVTPMVVAGINWLLMEIEPLDRALKISQEEMLISSQAMSRQLIRGLAHEIKNPLGGLRGAAQLLERELPNAELKDYTDIIISESDRLRKLVEQLLGPHKLLNPEPINIHEVLEHVRKLLMAENQSLDIIKDYDPSMPAILADREQLIQALLNIARNAMQALESVSDARLILRTRVQRKFTISDTMHKLICRLDIIDNGSGIPAEIADNLFFPMVSGRQGGTGLGLSISQSIVNQHKGLIKCDSEKGLTTFSLYLPLENVNE